MADLWIVCAALVMLGWVLLRRHGERQSAPSPHLQALVEMSRAFRREIAERRAACERLQEAMPSGGDGAQLAGSGGRLSQLEAYGEVCQRVDGIPGVRVAMGDDSGVVVQCGSYEEASRVAKVLGCPLPPPPEFEP